MTTPDPTDTNRFIFIVCQHGAETAAKQEIAREHPNLRLAFSRPGFVTFKVDSNDPLPEKFVLRSTLARTYGWSLGKSSGSEANTLVAEVLDQLSFSLDKRKDSPEHEVQSPTDRSRDHHSFHIWQRDGRVPGTKGFEPGTTPLAAEIGELFLTVGQQNGLTFDINKIAKPDEKVFDIVLVEPDQWWFGYHFANTIAGRWPGGVPLIDTTTDTISRAYFKAQEAIQWSGIEIQPGDVCAEIGSSPGGCCQLLLEMGATVIGIDPAEMEPVLLANEKFTHIRRRGHEVRKRDFQDVKWLFADLNIVPNYTLDTITEIVSHDSVDITGLILTMKLADWKLVEEVPSLMKRVREMGFSVVRARQLAFNRQEFCLVAIKDKFALRVGKKLAQQKRRSKR